MIVQRWHSLIPRQIWIVCVRAYWIYRPRSLDAAVDRWYSIGSVVVAVAAAAVVSDSEMVVAANDVWYHFAIQCWLRLTGTISTCRCLRNQRYRVVVVSRFQLEIEEIWTSKLDGNSILHWVEYKWWWIWDDLWIWKSVNIRFFVHFNDCAVSKHFVFFATLFETLIGDFRFSDGWWAMSEWMNPYYVISWKFL